MTPSLNLTVSIDRMDLNILPSLRLYFWTLDSLRTLMSSECFLAQSRVAKRGCCAML